MYAFYNMTPEDVHPRALDGGTLPKTKPKKEKFSMHANFCLTRHPMGGTEQYKDLDAPMEPTIAAAASWLESAEADLQDHGMGTMGGTDWPDFGIAGAGKMGKSKGKLLEGEVGEDGEGLDDDDGDGKKKKKGKKSKAKAGKKGQPDAEPEPEAGTAFGDASDGDRPNSPDDADSEAATPASKPKGKKGKTKSRDLEASLDETMKDGDSSPKDEDDQTSTKDEEKKAKKDKKKSKKDKLKVVVEEGDKGAEIKPIEQEETGEAPKARGRGRMRPANVDTQRGSVEGGVSTSPKLGTTPKKARDGTRPASEGSGGQSCNSSFPELSTVEVLAVWWSRTNLI